jgi:uncharacterized membrane protein YraQ (UPF0718 family)
MLSFFIIFKNYFIELIPALAVGLVIAGIIHEFIPDNWVEKYLGGKGLRPIILATFVTLKCCSRKFATLQMKDSYE